MTAVKKSFFIIMLFLFSASVSGGERKYSYVRIGSPDWNGKVLVSGYGKLIYSLTANTVYSTNTKIASDIQSCPEMPEMLCFIDPGNGWELLLPRESHKWGTWKDKSHLFVFEQWRVQPFSKKRLAAIHVFANSMVSRRDAIGGLSYPVATYFIDNDLNLIGMARYSLDNPNHPGLNINRIEAFYLAENEGVPLNKIGTKH
jgi:hypothetical protein